MAKERLILKHTFALGDTVLFTGLARDIQRAYPNRFELLVDTHFSEVWWNNPHARKVEEKDRRIKPEARLVDISYRNGIRMAGRGKRLHMLRAYHDSFKEETGLHVPVTEPCGDIHLSEGELAPIIGGDYWLLLSGGKLDLTIKHWWVDRWQGVVERLLDAGIFCVQAGSSHNGHIHPPLTGVLNIVGKYNSAREFFNLVKHAKGVICPVTAAMHIAACFDTPCVVLNGGREEPWWEHYTNEYGAFGATCRDVRVPHHFLHTLGQLDCCKTKGCWMHRTVPIDARDHGKNKKKLCKLPIRNEDGTQAAAKCMDMITVDQVVEAVLSYHDRPTTPTAKPDGPLPLDAAPMPLILGGPVKLTQTGKSLPLRILRNSIVAKPQAREQIRPAEEVPATGAKGIAALDHPLVGGKFTVFVLCYGPHTDIARRCLDSVIATVPEDRLDLRVALNECAPATIKYVAGLPTTKVYKYPENKKKYPVMRDMFYDSKCPITTPYLVWLDDDTKVVDPKWLIDLSQTIIANHPHGSRLYGPKFVHDLKTYERRGSRPKDWFNRADWHTGRHMRIRGRNTEAPNGTVIEFAAGWCWALHVETMRKAQIPDVRLNHNGGDITIGEQVHQAGFKVKMWNRNKSLVFTPPREQGGRRGYSEKFPWAEPVRV